MEVYQAVNGLKNEKEIIEERIAKRLREKLSRMLYKYLRYVADSLSQGAFH